MSSQQSTTLKKIMVEISSKFTANLEKNILEGLSQENLENDHKKVLMSTAGLHDLVILKSMMFNYLKKTQEKTEEILKTKDHECAELLAKDIRQFLTICYLRKRRIEMFLNDFTCGIEVLLNLCLRRKRRIMEVKSENQLNYEDILASLLAVYIDLHSVISIEDKNKTGTKLCSFILYLTEDCQDCRLSMLLDLCSVTEDFVDILLPTVRKCLLLNSEELTEEMFLKYILVLKTMMKKLDKVLKEELKAARRIKAPEKFIDWVTSHSKEARRQLSHVRKRPSSQLTSYLLDEAPEGLIDTLQEILIDLSSAKLCNFESQNRSTHTTLYKETDITEISPSTKEPTKKTSFSSSPDREEEPIVQDMHDDAEPSDDEPYFIVDKLGSGLMKIPHDSEEVQASSDDDDVIIEDDDLIVLSDVDDELLDDVNEPPHLTEIHTICDKTDTEKEENLEQEVFDPFFVDRTGLGSQKNLQTSEPAPRKTETKESDSDEPSKHVNRNKQKRKAAAILLSPEVPKTKTVKMRSKESNSYCLRSKGNLKRKKISTTV